MEVHVVLAMQNYIAHPYWPSKNTVIEIEKKSGVNRQKSEEKRLAALKAECQRQGYTYEEYEQLKTEAAKQWYRNAAGEIIIPRHQIAAAFVQTIANSPKALRGPFTKDNFRAAVQIGDFTTGLSHSSGVFTRFVKLEGSNQRNLQMNQFVGRYIDCESDRVVGEPFEATGVIIIPNKKHVAAVKALLVACVESVGIGASRKMGFGRGTVKTWKEVEHGE